METERHSVISNDGAYTREVWLLRSHAGSPHRLAVFLDGEHYIRGLDAVPLIHDLLEAGTIPPTTCVFVSHVDGAARHSDYLCNSAYARFITDDILSWARGQDVWLQPGGHLIGGLSLSSLAAGGATTHFTTFTGGHGAAPWRAELPAALSWLS